MNENANWFQCLPIISFGGGAGLPCACCPSSCSSSWASGCCCSMGSCCCFSESAIFLATSVVLLPQTRTHTYTHSHALPKIKARKIKYPLLLYVDEVRQSSRLLIVSATLFFLIWIFGCYSWFVVLCWYKCGSSCGTLSTTTLMLFSSVMLKHSLAGFSWRFYFVRKHRKWNMAAIASVVQF